MLELSTWRALEFDQLLGPYSRFRWHHPGPSSFYVLAPFYLVTGRSAWGLYLGAAAVNLASVYAAIRVSRALGGQLFSHVTAAGLGVFAVLFGGRVADPWNPHLTVLPVFLFLLLSWGTALGRYRWHLPAAIALGSFLVQTHVAYLVVVVALLGTALLFSKTGTAALRDWPLLAAAGGILFLMWLPVVLEQVLFEPGNVGQLVRFAVLGGPPWNPVAGLRASVRAISAVPLGVPVDGPGLVGSGPLPYIVFAVQLAGLGWAAVVARRRGYRNLLVLVALLVIAVAAALLSGMMIRGSLWAHLVTWTAVIGLLAWVAFAVVVLKRVPVSADGVGRWGRRVPSAILIVVVIVASVVVIRNLPQLEDGRGGGNSDAVRALTEPVLREAGDGGPVLVRIASHGRWPVAAGLVVQLVKEGVPVSVERSWTFMFGPQLEPTGQESTAIVIGDVDMAQDLASVPGIRELARTDRTVALSGPVDCGH